MSPRGDVPDERRKTPGSERILRHAPSRAAALRGPTIVGRLRDAALSGRLLGLAAALGFLAYVVALVAMGGDTIALTSTIEITKAVIDIVGLAARHVWALSILMVYALLAFAPASAGFAHWWDRVPRLDPKVPGATIRRSGVDVAAPRTLRRGLTGLAPACAFLALAMLFTTLAWSSRARGAGSATLPEGAPAAGGEAGQSPYRWMIDRTTSRDLATLTEGEQLRLDSVDLALSSKLSDIPGPAPLNTAASARVTLQDARGRTHSGTVRPWPGTRLAGRLVFLTKLGLAPRVTMERGAGPDGDATRVFDEFVLTDIRHAGQQATVDLTPQPWHLELTPVDAAGPVREGPRPVRYRTAMRDAEGKLIGQGIVGPAPGGGDGGAGSVRIQVEDEGTFLFIRETGAWAQLTIVRDPALRLAGLAVALALAAFLLAMTARLAPRVEIWPDPHDPSSAVVAQPRGTLPLFVRSGPLSESPG